MKATTIHMKSTTSGFKDHGQSIMFARAVTPGLVDGAVIQAMEYRKEVDGTAMPRFDLSVKFDALIVKKDLSYIIEDRLKSTETTFEKMTINTQFDSYNGFRAVDFYEENPDASFYRVHLSPPDDGKYWPQFYSDEFIEFLKENFDTRGIEFEKLDITHRIRPAE